MMDKTANRVLKLRIVVYLFLLLFLLGLSGCGTLAVEVERTPTPDLRTATVAALEQENLALNARVATLAAPQGNVLTLESNSETIRRKLLYSASDWRTIWADASLSLFPDSNQPEQVRVQRAQLWISQHDGRFRLVWGANSPQVDGAAISDGQTVRRLAVESGQISGESLPSAVRQVFIPPEAISNTIVPHPLTGTIGSPLADQLLPTIFGQRSGSFTVRTLDVIAGRDALVVDWAPPQGTTVDRLWVDVLTGVVLRWQNFGKTGGERVEQDYQIHQIQYDAEFPSELFDQQSLSKPFFAGDWQGNPEPAEQSMAEQSTTAQDEQGELYFYIRDPASQEQRLVSLPGSCLDGAHLCPEPSEIPGAPSDAQQPLQWSPTGKFGLLIAAQPDLAGDLLRYDPVDQSWTTIARDAVLAAWSPDGRVIAYASAKEVYLILAEGSNPRSMIAGQIPMLNTNITWLGWQDGTRLLVMVSRPAGQTVYLVDVATGAATEILQRPPKGGSAPVPSPDGQRWAMVLQEDSRVHLLISAAGSEGSPSVSYIDSNIWPISWSPDGSLLAFNVYSPSGETQTADLYVTRADGTSLQQVFRGSIIPNITWAPDSRSLVLESADSEGRTHLILIQIEEGQSKLIQAPGLDLTQDWIRPAWRK
jgi:hypothetical protein